MTFEFRRSALRSIVFYLWLAFISLNSFIWLGLMGMAICCVLTTPLLREHWQQRRAWFRYTLAAEDIRQCWVCELAVCVISNNSYQWLFKDEIEPLVWAGLRRYLKMNMPRQPLGLSISS